VNPDQTIGILASDAKSGDTEISVSGTVLTNAFVGMYVQFTDGVNTSDYSEVIALSDTTITIADPLPFDFAAASPTLVKQRTYVIKDAVINAATTRIGIDRGKISGGLLTANRLLRVYYRNNSGPEKIFRVYLETLY
jgi:hypothetical protein